MAIVTFRDAKNRRHKVFKELKDLDDYLIFCSLQGREDIVTTLSEVELLRKEIEILKLDVGVLKTK